MNIACVHAWYLSMPHRRKITIWCAICSCMQTNFSTKNIYNRRRYHIIIIQIHMHLFMHWIFQKIVNAPFYIPNNFLSNLQTFLMLNVFAMNWQTFSPIIREIVIKTCFFNTLKNIAPLIFLFVNLTNINCTPHTSI